MPCAPFSMLGSLVELAVMNRFLVHDGWDSRDVSVAGVYDCIKECKSFVM